MSHTPDTDELDKLFKKHAAWSYSNGKRCSDGEVHYYTLKDLDDLKQALLARQHQHDNQLRTKLIETGPKDKPVIEQFKSHDGRGDDLKYDAGHFDGFNKSNNEWKQAISAVLGEETA